MKLNYLVVLVSKFRFIFELYALILKRCLITLLS